MVNRVFNPPAAVQTIDAEATELELITTAKNALSACNWTVGNCAVQWTRRYSRGRSDADFGLQVGLSGEQVYQRRRVWEQFSNTYSDFACLKWSHFYVALNWEDREECLSWANENEATVAEMKAWRRLQNGEDLTVDEDELQAAAESGYGEPITTPQPETVDSIDSHEELSPITAPNHDPAETEYAPFRTTGGPPRDETREAPEKPARGKSDIALYKAFWRAGRDLINTLGTVHTTALMAEMASDFKLTDEVEEVDEPRLKSLLKAINRN